jgi:hypothetical protein
MNIFDPIKLEKLLIKQWIEFIDLKKVMEIAHSTVERQLGFKPPNIQNLKVTRFEIYNLGFVIWIEYRINNNSNIVNITIEIITDFLGNIKSLKSIY